MQNDQLGYYDSGACLLSHPDYCFKCSYAGECKCVNQTKNSPHHNAY